MIPSQQLSIGQLKSGVTSLLSVSRSNKFSVIPAEVAVNIAEMGLATVIIGSRSAYVIAMESIPDSGVEIRKAVVAPLLAPCFLRAAAAGRTPQEQRGIGTPIIADFKTDKMEFFPKCFEIVWGFRNTFRSPAISRPKRT